MQTARGLRRPKEFEYLVTTPFGTVVVKCRPDMCLIPDELSDKFGQLGATIIDRSPVRSVLDFGIGSGIFLSSLIMNSVNPNGLILSGIDVDNYAIRISRQNVRRAARARNARLSLDIRIEDRVEAEIMAGHQYALLFGNLGYLPTDEPVRELAAWAPEWYLYGGPDGLDQYRLLIPHLSQLLLPGGVALLRTGKDPERLEALMGLIRTYYPDPLKLAVLAANNLMAAIAEGRPSWHIQSLKDHFKTTLMTPVVPEVSPIFINQIEEVDPSRRYTTGLMVWFRNVRIPGPNFLLNPEILSIGGVP